VPSSSGLRLDPPAPAADDRDVVKLFLAAVLLVAAAPALALDPQRAVTQYAARTWHAGAEVPPAAIQAIAQTPDGYLWLGTMQGLVRFDGVRSTVFDRKNSGLPHDNVWSLHVDRAGRLWVGTDGGGLALWDHGVRETFSTASGLGSAEVRPVLQTKDGALWVGTRGGGVDRYADGRWTRLTTRQGLASDEVWALAAAGDDAVWVGAQGVSRCDKGSCTVVRTQEDGLPHRSVIALHVSRGGDLWVGTWSGLSRLRGGKWSDWTTSDGLPGAMVRAIHEDRDGNIWIGTSEGLARFKDGAFETFTREQGAAGGYVRALFEDGDGTLWIGSAGSGLSALRDGEVLNVGEREGLPRAFAFSVLEAPDGAWWVGTSHGLSRVQGREVRTLTTRDGLPSDLIGAIAMDPADPRGLWIGTQSGGLAYWKAGVGIVHRYNDRNGLPSNTVTCVATDAAGGLWIGTEGGLVEKRGGATRVYTSADGLPSSNVRAVMQDRRGVMWAGTYAGLAQLRDGRWSTDATDRLGRVRINALHEDAAGIVWAATSTVGLARLENGTGTTFDLARGFCTDVAYEVIEDDLGFLWTSSPQGLCRASRAALDAAARGDTAALPWRVYGRDDGIRDMGASAGHDPSAWKARDGRLLFATNAGIVVVDPRRLRPSAGAPPVEIEGLTANGAAVALSGPVVLGPGRPRLEFRFSAPSLLEVEGIRFQYRLLGFDADWVPAAAQRVAHYTNVPPGRYTFEVRAGRSDGSWNEKGHALGFVVRPHFWETTWFAAACALAALAAMGAAHRLRMSRVRARFLAVVDERTRVARELHDTLAQGVAGAKLQVESALETIESRPDSARRFLELGRALLSSSLTEVRRSIWVLRVQADRSPEGLGSTLSQSLALLTTDSGVEARLTLSGKEPPLRCETEQHLLRIAHEAVTNAVRHAHPRTLAVELQFEAEALELRVRDDGAGFDPERCLARGGDHFGLRGLYERTRALGGSLHIKSAPGAGTEVTCRVPYEEPVP